LKRRQALFPPRNSFTGNSFTGENYPQVWIISLLPDPRIIIRAHPQIYKQPERARRDFFFAERAFPLDNFSGKNYFWQLLAPVSPRLSFIVQETSNRVFERRPRPS
jgi:hypothetical protein